ncbi:DUF6115 domain-containing protein [Salimicrobium halophilum]|nr:hypothetical protein [Salimicrobium halophilum]
MTIFLLVVNFIIDGVIILGLFLLFTKMKGREDNLMKHQRMAREIEGTFQAYLEEIKEENKRFEQNMNMDSSPNVASPVQEIYRNRDNSQEQESIYSPPEIEENDVVEFSDETKAKQMYEEGLSIEEIAKKLGKGKTEVELIVKFGQS